MRTAQRRGPIEDPVRSLIHAFDQIARLLKFDRKEEGARDIDSLQLDALLIDTTGINLISPEGKTTRVRFAVEKIEILLSHEKVTGRNRIRIRRSPRINGYVRRRVCSPA